jgi:hypothetical protein
MIKLVFNTTEKTVFIDYQSKNESYKYIKTVKSQNGYYELIQEESDKTYPILRVPINKTIMYIEK